MNPAADDARALLERMDRVERRLRWLTAVSVVATLLCVAILCWQFFPLDSLIEARGFVLRDSNWQSRAEIRVRKDNSPFLRLNNRGGQAAATLSVNNEGAVSLRLYDTVEQERAVVRLDEHGVPLIALTGANGKQRLTLTAEETSEVGEQRIVLRDRFGRKMWIAPPADSTEK